MTSCDCFGGGRCPLVEPPRLRMYVTASLDRTVTLSADAHDGENRRLALPAFAVLASHRRSNNSATTIHARHP